MSLFEDHDPRGLRRSQRNWIADTIVVLGILAFGYFALMIDSTILPWAAQTSTFALPLR